MSSLWTPGGEIPVERNPGGAAAGDAAQPTSSTPPPSSPGEPTEAEMQAHFERLQAEMVAAPANAVVGEHAVALYQLAALHLSQETPRIEEARLAVDAFAALVEGLGSRLGEGAEPLRNALSQLRLAFVEVAGSAAAPSTD